MYAYPSTEAPCLPIVQARGRILSMARPSTKKPMLLGYIDESGTSYEKKKKKWFVDGPYGIWSCVLISEQKYFHFERTFQDIARRFLPATLRKPELHACEIWNARHDNTVTDTKVRKYFEELMQFATKMHPTVLFGIQQKNIQLRASNSQKNQLEKAQYSLLSLLENVLAEMDQTAVLVADEEAGTETLRKLVSQRTKWRFNPPSATELGGRPKFLFEARSNFIVDQLHYVDSKESLLMQFSDHICFVLRKALEQLYLLNFNPIPNDPNDRPNPDKSHVPVTDGTFNYFVEACNVRFAYYSEKEKDVQLCSFARPFRQIDYGFDPIPMNSLMIARTQPNQIPLVLKPFTPFG